MNILSRLKNKIRKAASWWRQRRLGPDQLLCASIGEFEPGKPRLLASLDDGRTWVEAEPNDIHETLVNKCKAVESFLQRTLRNWPICTETNEAAAVHFDKDGAASFVCRGCRGK